MDHVHHTTRKRTIPAERDKEPKRARLLDQLNCKREHERHARSPPNVLMCFSPRQLSQARLRTAARAHQEFIVLPVPQYVLSYARCLGYGQACYPCRCVWQQHFPPIEHGLEQHLQADVAWTILAHALMDDDGNDNGRHASIVHLGAAQPQQHFLSRQVMPVAVQLVDVLSLACVSV